MSLCTGAEYGHITGVTMTDPFQTDVQASRFDGRGGIALSAICAVCGLGLLVVCGATLGTCWQMIGVHQRQQKAQLKLERDFHTDLIRQMQALVGHSAASVTSDLCRVRFRLRLPMLQTPPAGTYRVILLQNPGPDEVRLENHVIPAYLGQVADFGMLAPGNYRLMIEDDLGMRCWHSFAVHPGAPIDQVVYCPKYESWMFRSEPVRFRLRFDWPTLWESRPIVAVVHLRSGAASSEGWEWQPPESQQFDGCVLISRDDMPGSYENAFSALPTSLAGNADVLPVVVDENAQPCVVAPYACCEVYGVSFLLAVPDEAAPFHHLGTFLYDDPDCLHTGEAGGPDDGILILSNECCRQVCPGEEPVELCVPLPELIVPSVLHVAEQAKPDGA